MSYTTVEVHSVWRVQWGVATRPGLCYAEHPPGLTTLPPGLRPRAAVIESLVPHAALTPAQHMLKEMAGVLDSINPHPQTHIRVLYALIEHHLE